MKSTNKTGKTGGKSEGLAKSVILNGIKGMLIGVIVTIALILIFGLIVKQANPDDMVIAAVNQVIKVLGIGLSAFFAIKGAKCRVFIYGGVAGLMYVVAGYLIFSAVNGSFGSLLQLLSDGLLGILIGIICAVIFGQLLRPKK